LISFFDEQAVEYEIIVVMDGCDDGTDKIVLRMAEYHDRLIPLSYPRKLGKGGALIKGFQHARGEYLVMLDADNPIPSVDLFRLIREAEDCGLVIGSRYVDDSKIVVGEPVLRIILSRVFNLLVRLMFRELREIKDTQCGVKVLKRETLKRICEKLFITDYVFDVNLIYSTIRSGFDVKEVGVTWRHDRELSKIRGLLKVSIRMLLSLIRLRIYYSRFKPILEFKLIRRLLGSLYRRF